MRKISRQLISKSEDSFLLALEIFNKPTVGYRLEAFSIFYTNAWELLLKAKIIENSKKTSSIFEKKMRGKPRETISLDKAIKKIFDNEKDPVRKNIEDISDIRNFSVHYIVPEMEDVYGGLFQQGVLNYSAYRKEWFGKGLSVKPRMLTLVFDFQPENVDLLTLKDKYSKEISSFYENMRSKIVRNIPIYGDLYCIPINHKLAFVKNPKKSDIVLRQGHSGIVGIPIEVPRDPVKTHPYSTKKLVEEMSKLTGQHFPPYNIYAINYFEKINDHTHPEYVYKFGMFATSSNQYSEKYRKFLEQKVLDNNYINKARTIYAKYLNTTNNAHKNS